MIRGEDDDGVVIDSEPFELADELPEAAIQASIEINMTFGASRLAVRGTRSADEPAARTAAATQSHFRVVRFVQQNHPRQGISRGDR